MLNKRQADILKILVDHYISTVEPVSSNYICELLNVSSATVRNEMTYLEKCGFIEKTHFASGRIPTEFGYKYYVENMVNSSTSNLSSSDSIKIRSLFNKDGLVLKDAVFESVKLISELTNYSVILLGGHSKFERLKEVKIVSVDDHSVVSIIVTSSGKVFNQLVSIDEELNLQELEEAVTTINDLLVDTPISEIVTKLETEIKPVLKRFIEQHAVLCEAFLDTIRSLSKTNDIKREGQDKLMFQPEFDDVTKIRELVKKLNDETLLQLINYSDEISVQIGQENCLFDDLSIVTTKYDAGSEEAKIAIIGPQRMDYNKVVGLLNEIKSNLERLDKENEDE